MKSRISDKTRLQRGLGKGDENHKPFIRPRDFSSSGRVHRLILSKAKNTQVALSDLERNYILLSDFALNVTSVKTQVALLPLEATQKIAWDLGIQHPSNGKSDIVMTTDILLDVAEEGVANQEAISVKPWTLITDRVIEKFQIEKDYWKSKGVSWTNLTEKELDPIAVNNVLFLRDYRLSKNLYGEQIFDFFKVKKSELINERIGELIRQAALVNRITLNDGRVAFLHLLSKQEITFEITRSFNWERKVNEFNVVSK
ncbi:TnsA endonuclease N-terminal domain-containing protein [soil metagenome]